MDTRQEETAARRRRLLDAAVEVLGDAGAERFTTEAVADRAGAAIRTLYNHFSSRDELIVEALSRLPTEFRPVRRHPRSRPSAAGRARPAARPS